MEANKNKNLGNAGEFYVLAQLAQRGYIAGKTDDGTTLIDVIATNPDDLSTVNTGIQISFPVIGVDFYEILTCLMPRTCIERSNRRRFLRNFDLFDAAHVHRKVYWERNLNSRTYCT